MSFPDFFAFFLSPHQAPQGGGWVGPGCRPWCGFWRSAENCLGNAFGWPHLGGGHIGGVLRQAGWVGLKTKPAPTLFQTRMLHHKHTPFRGAGGCQPHLSPGAFYGVPEAPNEPLPLYQCSHCFVLSCLVPRTLQTTWPLPPPEKVPDCGTVEWSRDNEV